MLTTNTIMYAMYIVITGVFIGFLSFLISKNSKDMQNKNPTNTINHIAPKPNIENCKSKTIGYIASYREFHNISIEQMSEKEPTKKDTILDKINYLMANKVSVEYIDEYKAMKRVVFSGEGMFYTTDTFYKDLPPTVKIYRNYEEWYIERMLDGAIHDVNKHLEYTKAQEENSEIRYIKNHLQSSNHVQ